MTTRVESKPQGLAQSIYRRVLGPLAERFPAVPLEREAAPISTTDALAKFLDSCRAKGLAARTLEDYHYRLRDFARASPQLPSEPSEIEAYLLSRPWGPVTRETHYRNLCSFYGWLTKRRYIKHNPMSDVDRPRFPRKVARALTPDEMHQLLHYPNYNRRIRTFLYLLADTGLRLGEALSLRPENIKAETVVVSGKTGEHEVPVSPHVRRMVVKVLPWPWSSRQAAVHAVCRAFNQAGINGERASAHTLRHTFVREWRGDESLLVGIMGWTSARMLQVYRPYDLERAIIQHRSNSRRQRRRKLT